MKRALQIAEFKFPVGWNAAKRFPLLAIVSRDLKNLLAEDHPARLLGSVEQHCDILAVKGEVGEGERCTIWQYSLRAVGWLAAQRAKASRSRPLPVLRCDLFTAL